MTIVILGTLLVLLGLVLIMAEPLWHGRLSGGRQLFPEKPSDTLEPPKPAGGFSFKSNRYGLMLVAAGIVLLLSAALD